MLSFWFCLIPVTVSGKDGSGIKRSLADRAFQSTVLANPLEANPAQIPNRKRPNEWRRIFGLS
jgi:hypothetical protein